jgi:glyoxylase-like metal-dependent hydrolase (beta-lactamase superfamily II)
MALNYHIIPVTPFAQNCSVLWCDATLRAAVIDAGGDLDRILDFVKKQGLTIEKLLLTHGHIDHAGAAGTLAKQLNIPIEGPQREDAFWLEQLAQQGLSFGLTSGDPVIPDRWLEEGDNVAIGQQVLKVIHCPGHTPGHVVFYSAEAKLLIGGDVLFQGSIGRTDFPRGNHKELLDSIHNKLFTLPDDTTVIPGHGPLTTLGEEKRSNPFVMNAGYR